MPSITEADWERKICRKCGNPWRFHKPFMIDSSCEWTEEFMTEYAKQKFEELTGITEMALGTFTISMQEQEEIMNRVFEECSKIRAVAQNEYAHDPRNAHANFDRIAEYLKIDSKKILFTYMYKHVDGVAAYVNGFESQREGVKNRINDIIVYLCLLRGLFERDHARAGKDKL